VARPGGPIPVALLVVLLAGCSADGSDGGSDGGPGGGPFTGPEQEALEFHALVGRAANRIGGVVTVRNPSSSPVRLEVAGPCGLGLVVLPAEGGADRPLWEQDETTPGGCGEPSGVREIPPEGRIELHTAQVSERVILGDSIAAGEYALAVRIRLLRPETETRLLTAAVSRIEARDPAAEPVVAGEPPPGAPSSPPWIRTDRVAYDLATTSIGWETTIPFRWTNPTSGPAFLVHCGETYAVVLEKLVDGVWVPGWLPFIQLCLSIPPIIVQPGETLVDTVRVFAGFPDGNTIPVFEQDDPEGVYRLVLFPLSPFDSSPHPFGEELPFEARVSNAFEFRVAP